MNHFFALTLPVSVQQYITDNIVQWWRGGMGEDFAPQWYAPDDYHITLKFLGDLPTTEQARLIAAARPIAEQIEPFMLRLAPPGTFPKNNIRFPRVFWMGVTQSEALSRLAAQIDAAMNAEGFVRESRAYTPHITLVRRRRQDSGRSNCGVNTDEQTFPVWQANALSLLQTRTPQERQNNSNYRYNTVHLFPLGTLPPPAK